MSRKHLINLLKLVVAAALIAFVLSRVDFQDVVDAGGNVVRTGLFTYLKQMDVWLALAGVVCYFAAASFSSVRWWWLLRVNDLHLSLAKTFRFTWIGVFFNNVVPGLTGGDVVKAVYVARATGKKLRPVLSVLVDRVMGLIALALLAAIMVLFRLDNREFIVLALALWGGLIALVIGASMFLSRRVRRALRLDTLLKKLPVSGILQQLDQALTHYRGHLGGIFFWLFLSIVNHVVSTGGVIFLSLALHGDMPPGELLILVPIINIVSAVPMAPGAWGLGEFLYQQFWTWFGPPHAPAQIVALAARKAYMGTQGVTLSIVYRVSVSLLSLLGALFLAFEKGRPSEEEMSDLMDEIDAEGGGEPKETAVST